MDNRSMEIRCAPSGFCLPGTELDGECVETPLVVAERGWKKGGMEGWE